MTTALPPWRQCLAASLHRNRKAPESRYVQLATVRTDGSPANRTVVFRGFGAASHELLVVSDTRSEKHAELLREPRAEIAWYFAGSREQYRFRGTVTQHWASEGDTALLDDLWQALSEPARAQYFGPAPGVPLPELPERQGAPIAEFDRRPPWFLVLVLSVDGGERLDLKAEPQSRERYSLTADGWHVTAVGA